ncbi:histidine kinase [Burkholderia ubonensis]|uniref:sensor histidine kinase n=1 Tax=Burkholderia ubonensis TaxID=101571 RepID=UPI0007531A28|nr:HAMP domain-containing sensor histidine kinase [Burkholderia ubonensis]KWB64022.1 histidine kinase [Burkholderia ubonensis]
MNEPHAAADTMPDRDTRAGDDALFRCAPIPILIEDWFGIKCWIDTLKARGVTDLEAYLDAHPDVIDEVRRLHAFVDANDATLSLFEAASKDAFFAAAGQLLPASRISNSQVLHAMFEGRTSCQGERTLSTLTGRKVPIVWRCSLPAEDDKYRRLHFYAFDVTEYKENDERLDALRSQLARTARASMMGQLVASITHEIGQPLGAIRTALDAAVRWLDRTEPDVAEATAAVRHASRWTDDMANICRRLRGFLAGAPVEAVELDCAEVVASAVQLVASEASAHAITLAAEVAAGATAHADRIQLQQVLTNLLINGIHAIDAAPADAREPLLRVRAGRYDDTHTLFEVVDNGCGISGAPHDAIFQPFSSTKRDGMGMGLPISKSIVEAHGGTIWIGDTGPHGTRICFTLPSSTHAAAAQRERRGAPDSAGPAPGRADD